LSKGAKRITHIEKFDYFGSDYDGSENSYYDDFGLKSNDKEEAKSMFTYNENNGSRKNLLAGICLLNI
jgi:hypothetical protein